MLYICVSIIVLLVAKLRLTACQLQCKCTLSVDFPFYCIPFRGVATQISIYSVAVILLFARCNKDCIYKSLIVSERTGIHCKDL